MNFDSEKVKLLFDDYKVRTDKAFDYMKGEFATFRAGRANARLLDRIVVDYYGAQTPLVQMANISAPEPRVLVVNLWDKSALKAVEKAILAANIGINPVNDGSVIRLTFPELTEERRRELVKQIKKLAEDCKVIVRNARRDVIEGIKKLKNDKELSEDDVKVYEKEVDERTTKLVENIDKTASDRETDIMSV